MEGQYGSQPMMYRSPWPLRLADGRIVTAHYLTREDGVRYIAGTHFRI